MILALIAAAEIGFWVLLAAGLAVRYLLRRRRASTVLLACVPLVDVLRLAATALDLRNGAEPSFGHGLAALYLGFTVAYGHYMIRWADGHAAHRLDGAPRPPKPPRYGKARARHEWRLWLMTLVAVALALAVLEAMAAIVGDADQAAPLRGWQDTAVKALVIHGIVALTYTIWPKKPPAPPAQPAEPAVPEASRPAAAAGREDPPAA